MKKQLVRAAAASVMGLSLMTGFAAADVNTTGPNSSNQVNTTTTTTHRVRNHNDVHLANSNWQTAHSGQASTYYNTRAGDAWTGNAANNNNFNVSASVNNTAATMTAAAPAPVVAPAAASTISTTGPGSDNSINTTTTTTTDVQNHNDITLQNCNEQQATSGSAKVSYNTVGGSAVSGDATNSNSTSFSLNISN